MAARPSRLACACAVVAVLVGTAAQWTSEQRAIRARVPCIAFARPITTLAAPRAVIWACGKSAVDPGVAGFAIA